MTGRDEAAAGGRAPHAEGTSKPATGGDNQLSPCLPRCGVSNRPPSRGACRTTGPLPAGTRSRPRCGRPGCSRRPASPTARDSAIGSTPLTLSTRRTWARRRRAVTKASITPASGDAYRYRCDPDSEVDAESDLQLPRRPPELRLSERRTREMHHRPAVRRVGDSLVRDVEDVRVHARTVTAE